jgi:hypothetical protein
MADKNQRITLSSPAPSAAEKQALSALCSRECGGNAGKHGSSHFPQCIKNCFIWTNCPNVPALLSKEVFYGHVAPPPPLRRAQGILSATEDTTLI